MAKTSGSRPLCHVPPKNTLKCFPYYILITKKLFSLSSKIKQVEEVKLINFQHLNHDSFGHVDVKKFF